MIGLQAREVAAETIPPVPPMHYHALDALRGIAALSVFFMHKVWLFNTHFNQVDVIHHFYLAVDFFFVLSGFVIATQYQQRLQEKKISISKFMLLRLGRIYPLHFAILMMYTAKILFFSGHKEFSVIAFVLNLFLVHSMGFTDIYSWNLPSWSISVEWWTYGLFALYAAFCLIRPRPLFLITLAAALLLFIACFGRDGMDVGALDYGLLRCIADFSIGTLLYHFWPQFQRTAAHLPANFLEIMVMIVMVGFITLAYHQAWTVVAPFLFCVVVGVFALGRGAISWVFCTRPFQELGKLSYSIYMNHYLFTTLLMDAFYQMAIRRHRFFDYIPTKYSSILGKTFWRGDALFALTLAGLILVSYGTYYGIEKPCREWVRRKLASSGGGCSPH